MGSTFDIYVEYSGKDYLWYVLKVTHLGDGNTEKISAAPMESLEEVVDWLKHNG